MIVPFAHIELMRSGRVGSSCSINGTRGLYQFYEWKLNQEWSLRRVWRYQRGNIRILKSKKDRQHNGQRKKDKQTNNDLIIFDRFNTATFMSMHQTRTYISFLCSMIWGERWLFLLLILAGFVTRETRRISLVERFTLPEHFEFPKDINTLSSW
jgi:hypothetical protein